MRKVTRRCSLDDCERKHHCRGLCESHYRRWRRGSIDVQPFDITPEQRVWLRVDQRGPDECWPWLGSISPDGYGVAGTKPMTLAHRKVWELVNGPIPEDLTVDHTCHNRDKSCPRGPKCRHRRCCNPGHLEPVPHVVNVKRAQRDTCQRGHPLDGMFPADRWRKTPTRYCTICYRARQLASRRSRRARGLKT